MNKAFLTLLLCSLFYIGTAQTKSTKTLFKEFLISLNSPIGNNYKSNQPQFGFGVGAKHKMFQKNNFILGIEYNFTRYFIKDLPFSGKSNIANIHTQNHSFTIPVSYRFNIGKKISFFLEPGVFFEYVLFSESNYTITTSLPSSNTIIKQESNNGDTGQVKYGLMLGIGLAIPYNKVSFFIKPELKIGKEAYVRLILGINI